MEETLEKVMSNHSYSLKYLKPKNVLMSNSDFLTLISKTNMPVK